MSSVLKENKNKESIDCAMKAIYKMEEKRKWVLDSSYKILEIL